MTWGKFDRAGILCSVLDLAKIDKGYIMFRVSIYRVSQKCGLWNNIVSKCNSWLCCPGDHMIIMKKENSYIDKSHVRCIHRVFVCYGIKARSLNLTAMYNISLCKDPFLYRPKMFHPWYLTSSDATLGLHSLRGETCYRQMSKQRDWML